MGISADKATVFLKRWGFPWMKWAAKHSIVGDMNIRGTN
jgi:hypothetical protein